MEKAAEMLGMSVEELTELRSQNEIFGYRDGATWKFKMSEIERVASDRGVSLGSDGEVSSEVQGLSGELDFSLSDEDIGIESDSKVSKEDTSDSIEIEDDSLDLILDDDSEESMMLSDSSEALEGDVQGSELRFGESDLRLAAESSNLLNEENEKKGSPSDTGELDNELSLAEDELFDDELSLQDSVGLEDSIELDSDFESSDMVLEDSDSSSEVALGANDSGINLSPNDSGISLEEEPLELGGSDIDSLELPEDDEMITLEEAGDPAMANQMAADDDFNLTPLEGDDDDESSGSQVIALEDSEIYADDSGAPVLADSNSGVQPALLPEDSFEPDFQPTLAGDMAYAPEVPEHPYTIFQILGLSLVAFFCLLALVVCYDVCRVSWQPEGQMLTSTVLEFFSSALSMDS